VTGLFEEQQFMTGHFNRKYVIFLAITAALGGLLFGFDIAIITGAGPFLVRQFDLSDLSLGWAFSSLLFGCVVGSFVAGRLTDRFGRKRMLIWVALLFVATSVATALAPNFLFFVLARLVGGLAVGGVSLLSPMYVSEVAPPAIRGRMGTVYQISIVIGLLTSYSINYLLRNTGPNNWRWMFLTGVVPSAVFLLLIALAPETPRFLVRIGKTREALALVARISGEETAHVEVAAIAESLLDLSLRRLEGRWGALLHIPRGRHAVCFHHRRALDDRQIWAQAALHRRISRHDAFAHWIADRCGGRALSRHAGACTNPGLSRIFLFVRGAGVLDACTGDLSQRCARPCHGVSCSAAVDRQRSSGAAVPLCVPRDWQGNHIGLPRIYGYEAGGINVAFLS
jgi:hypothetical protein